LVWGGIRQEKIDLNEDTLWSGEPFENLNTNGLAALAEIRRLLLVGQQTNAQALVEQAMNGKYNECYLPLGQLRLAFPFEGEVSDYRRELDLDQAITRVQFRHDGVHYTREVFASHPAEAIVVRLTSDPPGHVTFTASLDSQLRHGVKPGVLNWPAGPGTNRPDVVLGMSGRCPVHSDPHYVGQNIVYDDLPNGKGMNFEARLGIEQDGGRVRIDGTNLVVQDCSAATLVLVAATSYSGPHRSPSRDGKNPTLLCRDYLTRAVNRSYSDLRAAHISDHQALFNRVSIELGSPRAEARDWSGDTDEGSLRNRLPTDVRLRQYKADSDPALAALYFQFGRYLLIASSRSGTQPANLQATDCGLSGPFQLGRRVQCADHAARHS
jgi:alpha-L-fucosidase 2